MRAHPDPAPRKPRGAAPDALLQAARLEFETVGYEQTNTNAIARRAGYAPQTFYRHFPDKRTIFLEVYAAWVRDELSVAAPDLAVDELANRIVDHHRRYRMFRRTLRALTVSEVYANLTRTAGGDSTVARLTRPDPGQNAFITYASAARSEHQREQQALLGFLLNSNSNAANEHNPVGSLFSTEMLAMMSKERDRNAR